MIQGNKDDARTNGEGYVDQTAYEAVKSAERDFIDERRKKVKEYLWQVRLA